MIRELNIFFMTHANFHSLEKGLKYRFWMALVKMTNEKSTFVEV